jgi:hypothetical protein
MKKTFKWFDLIVQDRGGYMSLEKPLPVTSENLSSRSVNQMLATGSGNPIEEID